jgi:hypothetical protein
LIHSKKGLPELKKVEMKYDFEGFAQRGNFLHRNFFRFEMSFELKFGESRSIFDFRKLIKIARNRLKIQEFAWR